MSYFYGTPITSFNTCTEKRSRRKHSKQRLGTNDCELEPVHGSRHRRRHGCNSKTLVKPEAGSGDVINSTCKDDRASTEQSKGRRHLYKEIERLMEENRLITAKLEETETSNDFKDKDKLLTKVYNKYQKLEQKYRELYDEHNKLNILLTQKDTEYRELHTHHEQLTLVVQTLEQDQSNLVTATEKYKSENTQLKEDVSLLKNLVYRLNVELERYQAKVQNTGQGIESKNVTNIIDGLDSDSKSKKAAESWGKVNTHALGPLLNAYQGNLYEKQELIEKYQEEIDLFSGKCKEIVSENESLHKEVEALRGKCERYGTEIKTIEEDAAVIKEQNDLLTKQANLQKQKLQEIHSVYEHKVESMSQDNNKLHKENLTYKTELSNLQGKYEILSEGYEKLKNNSEKTMPISVHNSTVEECKRLFEELKYQYDTEKKKLNTRIKQLEENQPENEKQLILVTAERDQLKAQVKSLEKNLKRTQYKLDHIQKNICSIQISRESMKRLLNKTTAYCKELVAEQEKLVAEKDKLLALLKEKEKESEDIQYLGNNIAHRMGNLRNQLKSVQKGAKEQLASVEKQIKIQESGADQMKAQHTQELQRLKHLVRKKEEIIGKLQREKCATQDNLEFVWKAATSENKKIKDALKNTKSSKV